MWRNANVVDFVGWLRAHNDEASAPVGFYGLDLYSLNASIHAVIDYLSAVDPEAAERAWRNYGCFDLAGGDVMEYLYTVRLGLHEGCREQVVAELLGLRRRAADYLRRDGVAAADEFFYAEQNALVAANAEEYYRTMTNARVSSWNLRDRHTARTLEYLAAHLERTAGAAKIVVWAHNSHLGDARATDMSLRGELNVGQLMRERHGAETRNVGFTNYGGTVSASSDWGAPVERKIARPGLEGSYEALFHDTGVRNSRCFSRRATSESAACPTICWNARSASSIGRRPSSAATTFTRGFRRSSTRPCTSTAHAPSSR